MKEQNLKTLIIGLILLGTGLFLFVSAYVEANGLIDVVFETGGSPLFNEANFLPGQEIIHWVEVTNKSGQILPIGVKMTGLVDSGSNEYFLADKLNLIIKDKDSNKLYENSLTDFFSDGEKKIADLAAAAAEKYYFSITFLAGSDDNYQGLEVGFDFQIGALGAESIGGEGGVTAGGGGSSGGGGNYYVPGLEIYDEEIDEIGNNSATISWKTTKPATSRVIYSSETESHVLQLDNLPDYGYAHSTTEDSNPVISHSVVIDGLVSGATYYYRRISRGSFAVSVEHSFTTLGTAEETEEEEIAQGGEEGAPDQMPAGETPGGATGGSEEEVLLQLPAPFLNEIKNQAEQEETNPGRFLAAIGGLFGSINFSLILLIFIIFLLILFLFLLFKNRKKQSARR